MDLDKNLRESAPPILHITPEIEHEIQMLAEGHAQARGRRRGRFLTSFRSRRTALIGGLTILLVGGASVATAAPGLLEFFQPLHVDRTSAHTFAAAPDADACVIQWSVTSAAGSGHGEDNPAVIAAREYLLSLDLTSVLPDPALVEGHRNAEGREGPAPSERETHSVALMGTVARMVHAEIDRLGLDGPVVLHTTGCE